MADQPADPNPGNSSAPISQVPAGGPDHPTHSRGKGVLVGIAALALIAATYFGTLFYSGKSQNSSLNTQLAYQQTLSAENMEKCMGNLEEMISTLGAKPIDVTCVSDCCDKVTPEIIYQTIPTGTPLPPNPLEAELYCLDIDRLIRTQEPDPLTGYGIFTKREIFGTEKDQIIKDYFTLGNPVPEIKQCGECLLKVEYDLDTITGRLYEVEIRYGNCGVTPQPSMTPTQTGTAPYNPTRTPTPTSTYTPTKTPTPVTPTTTPDRNEFTPTYVTPFDDDTPTPQPTTTPVREE